MSNLFNRLIYICAVFLMLIPLVSCSGGGGGGGGGAGTETTFWITDGPSKNAYQAAYITIVEVEVNHEVNGWTFLTDDLEFELPLQLELLTLTNGVRAQLGIVDLEPGHYNQMRLILSEEEGANYVIDSEDNIIDLKVPSGGKSGIKLGNGFDIVGESTDIVLDFNVHKSVYVHPAGHSDKWVLRPTIRVVEIEHSVSGTIYEEGASALGDAWVSARSSDTEVAGASSELDDGTYFMYLPVNVTGTPYNIVAMKDDYVPDCQSLGSTASGEYIDVDFTLTRVTTIFSLDIDIIGLPEPPEPEPGEEPETFVGSFSIMQGVDCNDDNVPDTMTEVGLFNFVNADGTNIDYDPITLPVGDYEIVAWTDDAGGEVITLDPINITIVDSDVTQSIDFSQ